MIDAETVFSNRWLSFRGYFWFPGELVGAPAFMRGKERFSAL
jgi:hypothetical protein